MCQNLTSGTCSLHILNHFFLLYNILACNALPYAFRGLVKEIFIIIVGLFFVFFYESEIFENDLSKILASPALSFREGA